MDILNIVPVQSSRRFLTAITVQTYPLRNDVYTIFRTRQTYRQVNPTKYKVCNLKNYHNNKISMNLFHLCIREGNVFVVCVYVCLFVSLYVCVCPSVCIYVCLGYNFWNSRYRNFIFGIEVHVSMSTAPKKLETDTHSHTYSNKNTTYQHMQGKQIIIDILVLW